MSKGIALTIGLNSVSPEHYSGWEGKLMACEADANDMADVAETRGFQVKTVLTKDATRKNVIDEISQTAATLKSATSFCSRIRVTVDSSQI